MAEFDEVLVGGPRRQAADVQVGLTQLLCPSLATAVGARAGRSHWMRGWSIGLLGKEKEKGEFSTNISRTQNESEIPMVLECYFIQQMFLSEVIDA